jgi:hypothetical protein
VLRKIILLFMAFTIHFEAKSMLQQKHVIFDVFNVLLNVDIDQKLHEFVCQNAVGILQQEFSSCTDQDLLVKNIQTTLELYKMNRNLYSLSMMLMKFDPRMKNMLLCGQSSCFELSTEYTKKLANIYEYIEKMNGIQLCILDKVAINMCINILFGPQFCAFVEDNALKLEQCFSINPHGLALLDYILEVGIHRVYLAANIPREWVPKLLSNYIAIFVRVYPALAGTTYIGKLLHDSKCFFSCNENVTIESIDFINNFCKIYNVDPASCVTINSSAKTYKNAKQNGMNATDFAVIDFLPEQLRQDNWKRTVDTLKEYGVFESGRMYSYYIPETYLH